MAPQGLNVPGVPSMGRRRGLSVPGATGPVPFIAYNPALDTTSTGVIANRAAGASALDTNEYLFVPKGTTIGINGSGATLTTATNTGPEGQQTAARATFTTSTNFGLAAQFQNIRLAAGTYTLKFDLACAPSAALNQTIRCGISSNLQPVTVTSASWGQTFTQTFTIGTLGNYSIYIIYEDGAKSLYDVLFDNVRLYVGSSMPTQSALSGHLRFGLTPASTGNPSFAAKTLPANSNTGTAVLSAPKSFTEYTAVVCFRQTGVTGGGWCPILDAWENYNALNIAVGSTNNARLFYNGGSLDTGYLSFNGKGWGILSYRVKNGVQEITLNGVVLAHNTDAVTSLLVSKLLHGGFQSGGGVSGIGVPADIGPIDFYDTFLSDTDLLTAIQSAKTKLLTAGFTLATQKPFYLASGDSITIAGSSYAFRMLTARASTIPGAVFATTGVDIGVLSSNLTSWQVPSVINGVALGGVPIVSVLTGANSSTLSSDPTSFYNQMIAMYAQIRAAGGKALAITVLPQSNSAFNTARGTVNSLLRADPSKYDALADIDACAAGTDASGFDTTYYSDGKHPTTAGYDAITPVTQAALDAIVAAIP